MHSSKLFQVAEITIKYSSKVPPSERPQIRSARNAYDIFMSHWSDSIEHIEEFNVLLLNRANKVLGFVNISKGGIAGTVVDAKVIFGIALKANASSIILAHNHPSSSLKPSQADIDITKKLRKGGEFLDIAVLDHLIVTPFNYYSFADQRMF